MNIQSTGSRPTFFLRLVSIILIPSLLYFAVLVIDLLLHLDALGGVPGGGVIFRMIVCLLIAPATMTTGAIIFRRTSGNVVGLLLMLIGVGVAASSTRFDVESPGVAIAYTIEYVYNVAIQLPAFVCLLFYFPNGQVYPRRAAGWISAFAIIQIFGVLIQLLAASRVTLFGDVTLPNPFFLPVLDSLNPFVFSFTGGSLFGLGLILAVISIFRRYRASGMLERAQIRWLAFCGFLYLVSIPGWILANVFAVLDVWRLVFNLISDVLPLFAVGIAILRHRLYDIDIIIRRTLIYSVLTAILALIYFGGVVLAQAVLRGITGENSDAAIVVSTLVIAALFTPLRRRVQNVIDRRFYRRKYDAERTLAAFNATMRDEVDLDKLQGALVNVVQETMQPKVISLWIRSNASQTNK